MKTTTDQKFKIVQKLKETEEDNDRMRDQIARQASNNQRLNDEMTRTSSMLNDQQNTNKIINEKCKTKFEILNKELEDKDNQLEKMLSQIKAKDETIKYYSVNNEQVIRNQNQYKEDYDQIQNINKELEAKVRNLESTLDEFYVNRKSEAALLLEIEHLKDDNIRLLQMLKSTEEFKDFAYLAENVTGGIRFIKTDKCEKRCQSSCKTGTSTAKLNKSQTGIPNNKSNCFIKECEKSQIEKEDPFNGDNWVPSEAYNYTCEFRNKYKVEMSDNLINDLLASLNKIWRDREKKQIARIKTKYQNEVMSLRRKMNMRSPYDEFTALKTISKLKKDLKQTRDDLRNNVVESKKLKSYLIY